jgi:HSP20 family protein
MSTLTRWNPFQELRDIERLFDRVWAGNDFGNWTENWTVPVVDIFERDNSIVVQAELPGFSPDQIDISVENNVLHLKGEQKTEQSENNQYHLHERTFSSFRRSFTLPMSVDVNKAEAVFENGVLTLTLPKDEAALPKKINVVPNKEITAKSKS